MKENKYDNEQFFNQYQQMTRSKYGLKGAGEWHEFKKMFPDFKNHDVLDLGCGMGWHCKYAIEQGASSVIGIDISTKMLQKAKEINAHDRITYLHQAIEDFDFPCHYFDSVISSLCFHYIKSFDDICSKVHHCLKPNGDFVFSVEHPIFTAEGQQDWYYDHNGNIMHWPVDSYFKEGVRETTFLNEKVVKYHRTLTTYINTLIKHGFEITKVVEPTPQEQMLINDKEMLNELRRPMMLLISAKKRR